MIDAMYSAVLLPPVRYHEQLSATAKLIFCEMTACVDENQTMENDPSYFVQELHLPQKDVSDALRQLYDNNLISDACGGKKIWVNI